MKIRTDHANVSVTVKTSQSTDFSGEPKAWLTVDRDNTMAETVWLTKLQAQQLAAALLESVSDSEDI